MNPGKNNYFIGQIVDRDSNEGPFTCEFIDEDGRKRKILGAGFINVPLEDPFLDEKVRKRISNNPESAMRILCEEFGMHWDCYAGSNSIFASFDTEHLHFASYGEDNLCYKVNHKYTSYYSNNNEVLKYLGYNVEPSYGYKYIDTDLYRGRINEGTGGYGKSVCIYRDEDWIKPEKVETERGKRIDEFKQSLLLITDKKVRDDIIQKFDELICYDKPLSESCERIIYVLKSKNR